MAVRKHRRPLGLGLAVLGLVVILLGITGCADMREPLQVVDLDNRSPVASIRTADPSALRIGVAAVLSPEGTAESYAALGSYFAEQLGLEVQLVQRRTYQEINDLVAAGDVDLAFVCTSAYVVGSEDGIMDLLVVPEIDGRSVYRSAIIVPSMSQAETMADLRGSVFAFTDPMSLTGRAYPSSMVTALGDDVDSFFSKVVFTYSHDDAIRAVAHGVVNGAGVDEIVLVNLTQREPDIAAEVRVISRSPEFGIPPVVVPSSTPEPLRQRFADLFVGLSSHPVGDQILADLGVERFVVPDDDLYSSARALMYGQGGSS